MKKFKLYHCGMRSICILIYTSLSHDYSGVAQTASVHSAEVVSWLILIYRVFYSNRKVLIMIFLFPNLLPKIPSCLIMKCCHTVVSVGKYKILLWYILRYSSRLVFLSSSGYVRVYGRSHDGYAQLPSGLPARQTSQHMTELCTCNF